MQKSCVDIRGIDLCSNEELSLLGEVFRCCSLEALTLNGCIGKLPEYKQDSYFPSLTTISLWCSRLEEDPFVTFEKLPNLLNLLVVNESYMGNQMVCSATGFPKLRRLNIRFLPNLEKWRLDEGAMANLSFLEIIGCDKLEMLPGGLRFVTALRQVTIGCMPEAFEVLTVEFG